MFTTFYALHYEGLQLKGMNFPYGAGCSISTPE